MKFKADITCEGMVALEKRFLPTMEKFGKTCYMMVSPDTLTLIQDVTQAEGMLAVAQLHNNYVFDPAKTVCESLTDNHIAFRITIQLFLKALSTARSHYADSTRVKLRSSSLQQITSNRPEDSAPRPMLAFTFVGRADDRADEGMGVEQEMPVGQPLAPSAIHELRRQCDVAAVSPFYVNVFPEATYLMCVVDRLKPLSDAVSLSLTKHGDLHLTIEGQGITLGESVPKLEVLPYSATEEAKELHETRPEARLKEAHANGDAASASLQLSHLSKVLHSMQLTKPDRVLVGTTDAFVHVLFVYKATKTDETNDDDLALFYKLPIREE